MNMHCWLKRWQLVQRPSVEFSNPEQRICIALLASAVDLMPQLQVSRRVPSVDDSTDKQWPFSAAAPRPDRPPAAPGAAALVRMNQDGTQCMGVGAGRPRSYWEVVDIATRPGSSVEAAAGIAMEGDSKRGHARGEEDRRPAGTRRISTRDRDVSSSQWPHTG